MDYPTFEGLIKGLEAESERSPAQFRTKVFLISNCAYIVLATVFVVMGALIYFLANRVLNHSGSVSLLVMLCMTFVPTLFVTLRAFLIRLEAPTGFELTPKNAPEIFKILKKMQQKLNGPDFHRVIINAEYNAAIVQNPRWGLFGGYKNHLIIGLPYLFGTSPKETLATIAHEYGHVAGNHGKLGAWVYRQRVTFGNLRDQLEKTSEDNLLNGLLYRAVYWFWPYFNAYTFVLSRQNEYEADRTATQLIGASPNATGLIRDTLLGSWIHQHFWPIIYKQAKRHHEPAFKPYANMQKIFASSYAEWATAPKLQAAWRVESNLDDTHPCLSERVTAIGEKAVLPAPIQESAAEKLLGKLAIEIAHQFDADWWQREKSDWQQHHQRSTKALSRIKSLNEQAIESLPIMDLHELAMLSVEFDASHAKMRLSILLNQSSGNFSKADLEYGKLLLQEKNDAGLKHIEKAGLADKTLLEDCAHIGYYYLLEHKGEAAASQWWDNIYSA